MPKAPKACSVPGCSGLVRDEKGCPRHPRSERRRSYDHQRGNARARGYDSQHERWRAAVLRRDRGCKGCGKPGQPSDHADHITPIRDGGARFNLDNGQRLCQGCHASKTATEAAGKTWVGRRGPGATPPSPKVYDVDNR